MKTVGILSFTKKGKKLEDALVSNLSHRFTFVRRKEKEKGKLFVANNFQTLDGLIFVGALGIAVRFISPYIKSKDVDPAVVVVDELGGYAISVLSGHLGGANELAQQVAESIGATPVITTATDVNGVFAVDVWAKKIGCEIEDISKIMKISAKVLDHQNIGFHSDFPVQGTLPEFVDEKEEELGIVVSLDGHKKVFKNNFNAIPKIVTVGAGCRKGKETDVFEAFLLETLEEEKISLKAVERLASIDLKKEEECMIAFSKKYGIPFETYSPETLAKLIGEFTPSRFVSSVTGVDNVCERSAFLGSEKGTIIMRKKSKDGMTISLGVRDWQCTF